MTALLVRCSAGEKLEGFAYTFQDADGNALDLDGHTAKVTWLRYSDDSTGEFTAQVVGTPPGMISFLVPAAVTATRDVVDLQVWAGDSDAYRYAGKKWRIVIESAAGTAPTV